MPKGSGMFIAWMMPKGHESFIKTSLTKGLNGSSIALAPGALGSARQAGVSQSKIGWPESGPCVLKLNGLNSAMKAGGIVKLLRTETGMGPRQIPADHAAVCLSGVLLRPG